MAGIKSNKRNDFMKIKWDKNFYFMRNHKTFVSSAALTVDGNSNDRFIPYYCTLLIHYNFYSNFSFQGMCMVETAYKFSLIRIYSFKVLFNEVNSIFIGIVKFSLRKLCEESPVSAFCNSQSFLPCGTLHGGGLYSFSVTRQAAFCCLINFKRAAIA